MSCFVSYFCCRQADRFKQAVVFLEIKQSITACVHREDLLILGIFTYFLPKGHWHSCSCWEYQRCSTEVYIASQFSGSSSKITKFNFVLKSAARDRVTKGRKSGTVKPKSAMLNSLSRKKNSPETTAVFLMPNGKGHNLIHLFSFPLQETESQ